jgi:RecA-family ATPase
MQYFYKQLNKFSILKQPEEEKHTIKGLPLGEVGLLVAPGATGKSYMVLNMLLASCGLTHNHLIEKPIKTLYVSLEDRVEDIQRRLYAYKKALNLSQEVLEETELDFKIIENKSTDRLIIKDVPQKDNPLFQELSQIISDERYELVIIDTLIKSYTGFDENNNADMAMVLSHFNTLAIDNNCSILLLHHTNKSAINPNSEINQSISRGASSLVDNARFVLSLSKNEDDTGVICQSVKTNFSAPTFCEYKRAYKGALILKSDEYELVA